MGLSHLVSAGDVVFADDDGVLFVAAERAEQVLVTARQIWQTERDQAGWIRDRQLRIPRVSPCTATPSRVFAAQLVAGGVCARAPAAPVHGGNPPLPG